VRELDARVMMQPPAGSSAAGQRSAASGGGSGADPMPAPDEPGLRVLLVRPVPESAGVALVRRSLEALSGRLELAATDSLAAALSALDAGTDPDLLLIAPRLPDAGALEALERLASRHPNPLRVLLLGRDDEHLAEAALAAGADDCLLPGEIDPRLLARVLRYAGRCRVAETGEREADVRYRTLFERAPDGLLVVDERGILRDVNSRLAQIFGYEPGELVGEAVERLVPEVSRDVHVDHRRDYGKLPVPRPMGEGRHLIGLRKDGSTFPVEVGLAPLSPAGRRIVATVRDLSPLEERRRLADIVDASDDAILGISLDGSVESWNRGAELRFDRTRDEALGRPVSSVLAPEIIEELPDILRRVRAGEHVHSVENLHITEAGRRVHLAFAFSPLTDRSGRITGAAVIGRDITRQKILETDLEELAYQDPLTRVANRRFLRERLEYTLSLARREKFRVGLVYLDMGGFKEINDQFGHSAGDAILAEVARRLKGEARESDLVARFGGDEFVILLSKVDDESGALEATRRFEATLDAPVRLAGGAEARVRAQFGVALYPDHGEEVDELLASADRAMYALKEARWTGRSGTGTEETVGLAPAPSLERRIRDALADDRLRLFCQPILRGADGSVVGAEVLVRWDHPEAGLIAASEFLPSAGELGLMPDIDRWVVSRLLKTLRERRLPENGTWLAVNVSDRTVADPGALDALVFAVEELGPPAAGLRVELRESPAITSPAMLAGMRRIGEAGGVVVLDNYGVGQSSLAQLADLPAGALKLDRALLRRLGRDPSAERVVHAAIALGRAVSMDVGVEGVERASQASSLRGNGCDFLQGFYFGRPLPLEEFLR
jgi:diguanylate cyclase (GGDEF)-like protein/PAS domain S-box-containing protein